MPSSTRARSVSDQPTSLPHPEDRACPFCSTVFSRADGARRHAKRCTERGARPLIPRKRGRKALSCDRCSRVKSYCNAWSQTPCEACAVRKADCTFSRGLDDVAALHPVGQQQTPQPSPPTRERVPLSFLLNSTDDEQSFFTEQAVAQEPESALLGPISAARTSAPISIIDHEAFDCIDPMLLLVSELPAGGVESMANEMYTLDDNALLGLSVFSETRSDRLATRINLLTSDIRAHAAAHARFRETFDQDTFADFFGATNVHEFAMKFCRKRHYWYHLIHWPTFSLEHASLPLLLVVALTGASYSYRTGQTPNHVLTARRLCPLADSYVSRCLEAYLATSMLNDDRTDRTMDSEAVQLCQAALLMYGLDTLSLGDATLQRTAITQRLPALVSALRGLHYIGCQHNAGEDWELFLRREHIIRLVAWTFCADCLASLSFNHPPCLLISEMTGDLPCDPAIWDADSALDHNRLGSAKSQSPSSLKTLMSVFLGHESQSARDMNVLPIFTLQAIICGELSQVTHGKYPLISQSHRSSASDIQSSCSHGINRPSRQPVPGA